MLPREIPGFVYDPERNRYFRVAENETPSADSRIQTTQARLLDTRQKKRRAVVEADYRSRMITRIDGFGLSSSLPLLPEPRVAAPLKSFSFSTPPAAIWSPDPDRQTWPTRSLLWRDLDVYRPQDARQSRLQEMVVAELELAYRLDLQHRFNGRPIQIWQFHTLEHNTINLSTRLLPDPRIRMSSLFRVCFEPPKGAVPGNKEEDNPVLVTSSDQFIRRSRGQFDKQPSEGECVPPPPPPPRTRTQASTARTEPTVHEYRWDANEILSGCEVLSTTWFPIDQIMVLVGLTEGGVVQEVVIPFRAGMAMGPIYKDTYNGTLAVHSSCSRALARGYNFYAHTYTIGQNNHMGAVAIITRSHCLYRLRFDCKEELTACCFVAAEKVVFCSRSGGILLIDLHAYPSLRLHTFMTPTKIVGVKAGLEPETIIVAGLHSELVTYNIAHSALEEICEVAPTEYSSFSHKAFSWSLPVGNGAQRGKCIHTTHPTTQSIGVFNRGRRDPAAKGQSIPTFSFQGWTNTYERHFGFDLYTPMGLMAIADDKGDVLIYSLYTGHLLRTIKDDDIGKQTGGQVAKGPTRTYRSSRTASPSGSTTGSTTGSTPGSTASNIRMPESEDVSFSVSMPTPSLSGYPNSPGRRSIVGSPRSSVGRSSSPSVFPNTYLNRPQRQAGSHLEDSNLFNPRLLNSSTFHRRLVQCRTSTTTTDDIVRYISFRQDQNGVVRLLFCRRSSIYVYQIDRDGDYMICPNSTYSWWFPTTEFSTDPEGLYSDSVPDESTDTPNPGFLDRVARMDEYMDRRPQPSLYF